MIISLMKMLFTKEELDNSKQTDKLPCECYICHKIFMKHKRDILKVLRNRTGFHGKYCSKECVAIANTKYEKIIPMCYFCSKEIKYDAHKKNNPNKRYYCDQSCAAKYNNAHKTKGTRVSKFEIFVQQKLTEKYPDLEIHYNRKDAINSELDIFIPSLKLAFELNGIFHYEPIFGKDKLESIQNNDKRKFQACLESGIELCIIDTSKQKYYKEKRSMEYFDIICNIINIKL